MFIMLIKALVSVVIRNTLNISLVVLINTFINQSNAHRKSYDTRRLALSLTKKTQLTYIYIYI